MKMLMVTILLAINCTAFASDKSSPSVSDLSLLSVTEDQSDLEEMSLLKTRRQMLNWHTYTGWVAVGLMGATLVTAPSGTFDNSHKWLGIAAGAAYLSSASLAYLAPSIDDSKISTNIVIHEKLALIHAPAMLLSMYSGIKAHQDRKDGKDLSSIAKMHAAFSAVATVSFGLAAITSMDWTMSLIPTGKKEVACLFSKSF